MLTEIYPPAPDSISEPEENAVYHKWCKADKMARCYILASMSIALQQQHERMLTAYDIMMNLKEIFGHQSRAGRQEAMRSLLNTKITEGTSVQEHVLNMIAHLNELEVFGAEIDWKTQVDIVLMSLPESFKLFNSNIQ